MIVSAYLTLIACLMVTTGKLALALLPTTLLLVATLAFTQGRRSQRSPSRSPTWCRWASPSACGPRARPPLTVADGEAFSSVEREPVHDRTRRTVLVIAITAGLSMLALLAATATGLGTIRSAFDPHRTGGYTTDTDVNAVTQATRWQTAERDPQDPLHNHLGRRRRPSGGRSTRASTAAPGAARNHTTASKGRSPTQASTRLRRTRSRARWPPQVNWWAPGCPAPTGSQP